MSKARARNSPLRDYMLELHKRGIKVTFYEGRPENPDDRSQMFFVEMPTGYTIEDHVEILSEIQKALDRSATTSAAEGKGRITRQVAEDYVSRAKLFREQTRLNK